MGRWRFLGTGLAVLFLSVILSNQGLAEERYTVKAGDSLYVISKTLGVSVQSLKTANGLKGDALDIEFRSQVIYKAGQLVHENCGRAAAEIEVVEFKSQRGVHIDFFAKVREVSACLLLLEQVAVETAERA